MLHAALFSDSSVLRQAAQREFVQRAKDIATATSIGNLLSSALGRENPKPSVAQRVAALYTAVQIKRKVSPGGPAAPLALLEDPEHVEFVLRALADYADKPEEVPSEIIVPWLADKNPRNREAALIALRRLRKADAAQSILPLVADDDPILAHLAFRALRELKASQVCLTALDSADDKVKPGALKALYGIYDSAVVDGLIQRLPGAQGELRRGLLNALCRLANQDAPYQDPKVWWSTRPDTSGPIYQPIAWSETEKISAALKTALDASSADDAKWLVQRMYQCKVTFPGLVELMLAKAGGDTPARLTAIEGMVRNDNSLPAEAIGALKSITANENEAPDQRARALRVFIRCAENGTVFPGAVEAFAPLAGHDLPDAKLTTVFEDFTRGAHNAKWVNEYNRLLHGNTINGISLDGFEQRRQLAATVLVNLATGRVGRENEREAAKNAVMKGFDQTGGGRRRCWAPSRAPARSRSPKR